MTLLHEWRPVLVCLIALAWTCSAGVPAFAREAALVDHSDQDSAKADDKADKADKADSGTPKAKSKKKKKKAAAKDAATAFFFFFLDLAFGVPLSALSALSALSSALALS